MDDNYASAIGRIECIVGFSGIRPVSETVEAVRGLARRAAEAERAVSILRAEFDAAVEALRHASEVLRSLALVHCGHDGDEESGQCDDDCARCAIEGALAHAASVRGGVQLARARSAGGER